jgi:uncharacterized protein
VRRGTGGESRSRRSGNADSLAVPTRFKAKLHPLHIFKPFRAENLFNRPTNCRYTTSMLLRFRFSNFQSFRSQQEFSLLASLGLDSTEDLLPVPALKEKALRAAAIYGANASGKTTVLRALQFMVGAVKNSHRLWEPDRPAPVRSFRGGPEMRTVPSGFEADFLLNDVRHQYGFSLDAEGIVQESLSAFPNGKKQRWFTRERGKPIAFGRNLPGDNKTIAGLTRNNSLFVSAAAQNNHETLSAVYNWFVSRPSFIIGDRAELTRATAKICANDEDLAAIAQLVSIADLGIADVKLRLSEIGESSREKSQKFIEAMVSIFEIKEPPPPGFAEPHPSFQLLHRIAGSIVPFDLEEESNGTIAYLALLGPITRVLMNGGALFIDELDRSLHPIVATHILSLFKSAVTNPRGGQLVFNTHDTSLLRRGLLRRDQVWFTEKDRNGESHLYPLTDFKPRKEENLASGYLQGRYGAIPFMNPESSIPGWDRDEKIR